MPATRAAKLSAAVLAALAAGAAAAEDGPSKLYAGVGLGLTDFAGDHGGIGYDHTPLGLQLYGGVQVRERMAVELAVDRLAGMDTGTVLGSGVERLQIATDYSAVTVRGVFSLSLEEVLRRRQKIAVFGIAGVTSSLEERSVAELTSGRQLDAKDRDTGPVLGIGVTIDTPRVRWRAQLQSVDRDAGDLRSVGVAAEFRF